MGCVQVFVLGFLVGAIVYDLISDRKVTNAVVKAYNEVKEGFRKQREEVKKNDEVRK